MYKENTFANFISDTILASKILTEFSKLSKNTSQYFLIGSKETYQE